VIRVKPHQYFKRRESELLITARINVAQAALGHVLMVPTLTPQGVVDTPLDIPAGTQSGESFILKGKGVPRLRHDRSHAGYGDMHVMIEVTIPKKLTPEQQQMFHQLSETLGEAVIPPAHEPGFFERVLGWLGGE
jgi:molecular chaperone DnaJ